MEMPKPTEVRTASSVRMAHLIPLGQLPKHADLLQQIALGLVARYHDVLSQIADRPIAKLDEPMPHGWALAKS